ncbi:hypothetical protein L209DRAFT_758285 [Thermothelomyces heterothallicus CBS 203.75]
MVGHCRHHTHLGWSLLGGVTGPFNTLFHGFMDDFSLSFLLTRMDWPRNEKKARLGCALGV